MERLDIFIIYLASLSRNMFCLPDLFKTSFVTLVKFVGSSFPHLCKFLKFILRYFLFSIASGMRFPPSINSF